MSVEHTQSKKEIKINDKYTLNIESQWEDAYSWDKVNLTDGTNCIEVGTCYTSGTTYEREWLEYNDNYVAILHQDLISMVITIKKLIDLENCLGVNGTPEEVRDYYTMLKEENSSIKSNRTLRKEKLNERTSILIENKTNTGISIDEVAIEKVIFSEVDAKINIGQNKSSEVYGYIGRRDYLGPQVTFDNNGLKGWVEYNSEFVAFIDYNPATNKRRVNRIFYIYANSFLNSEAYDLEQVYNQTFAPEFIFKQHNKLPVKKLELKNNIK